ncbi:hypothetical protein M0802_010026 [Mischocyttarus mexicanus]|nr:hypothetical protein M0802_010026 [Mischocyttarus mexicanus]
MNTQKESSENVDGKKENLVLSKIKKSEYLKGLIKLKNQEYILERGLTNLIDNMKLDADVVKSLSREEKDLSTKRQNIFLTLDKTVSDIKNDVKMIKLIVSDPKQIQKLDVNEFKSKLIGVSKKLNDFKKTCPLEVLSEKGNKLDSDLKEFSSNLHKYNSVNRTSIKSSTIDLSSFNKEKKENHMDYDDCEKIDDFHTLIAKTGHTQNWSNEDHSLFVKMRKKCKNIPTLVNAIRTKCPDLTIETIINHETWYKLYLDLREKQRFKIKEWRKKKNGLNKFTKLQKEGIVDKKNLQTVNSFSNDSTKNIPNEKEEEEEEEKKEERSNEVNDKNLKKKELIKKWKLEKEEKRMIDEEQSKLRLESKRLLKEKRERIRIENQRESLRDYKNKRSINKLIENSKKEFKNVRAYDPTLIKEFRKQDEEYVRKRRMQQLSRTNKSTTTSTKYRINTNSSTLCKATKSWQEKCKLEDFKIENNQKIRYIKDLPKL